MTAELDQRATPSVRPEDLSDDGRAAVQASPGAPPQPTLGMRALHSTLEFAKLVAVALVMAFLIKSFLVQAFYIPSGSMLDTLQLNDRVLVEKLTFRFRDPERGEIIVFRRPGLEDHGFSLGTTARSFLEGLGLVHPDEDRDLIKRIIGLPGERVRMEDGVVYINDRPLPETDAEGDPIYTRPDTRDFPEVRVPGGHYFVMGDNRPNSLDSRFALGMIPRDNVIGRAFVILWPPKEFTLSLDQDYPGVGETPIPLGS